MAKEDGVSDKESANFIGREDTVLLTGGSGFLGRHLLRDLGRCCASIDTLGRSQGNDVRADLAACVPILPHRYDVVIHAAGLAHVATAGRESDFMAVNAAGTEHLCESLEGAGAPRAIVYISSVAVYGCEAGEDIDESHPLDGCTSYAKSKIEAERILTEWCEKHGVSLCILRSALIAGADAPGNLGNMIRGILTGRYFNVAGGTARRSMVYVSDLANLICKAVGRRGVYNVCADTHPSFAELSAAIAQALDRKTPLSIPYSLAKCAALAGDVLKGNFPVDSKRLRRLVNTLTFSNVKIKEEFGWKPGDVAESLRESLRR